MDVSVGLFSITLLFLYIIFPGYLARRFYYHGEFSQEVNLKQNLPVNIIYSSYIGILMLILFTIITNNITKVTFQFGEIICDFYNNVIQLDQNHPKLETKQLPTNEEMYFKYIPWIVILWITSATLGYISAKIVMFLKLDTRYMFFRFNNNWHYLFNGKILKIKKNNTSSKNKIIEVEHTYLDVLVSTTNSDPILYSGFYSHYELESKNQLKKLYLFDTKRQIKTSTNKIVDKKIIGDLFEIEGNNILNINYKYFFKEEEDLKKNAFLRKSRFLFTWQLITLFCFIFLSLIVIFQIEIKNFDSFRDIISKTIWIRLYVVFTLNILFGILTPYKINMIERNITFKYLELFLKILLFGLLYSIYYFTINNSHPIL